MDGKAFHHSKSTPFYSNHSCISCRSSSQVSPCTVGDADSLTVSDHRLNDEIQSQTRGWQASRITLLAFPSLLNKTVSGEH